MSKTKTTLPGFALLLLLAGLGTYAYLWNASITRVKGNVYGMADIDVYAFREDQIDLLLAANTVNGKLPNTRAFFAKLPFSAATAHTKSGPYSAQYEFIIPRKGKFVIASRFPDETIPDAYGKHPYWLVRVPNNTGSVEVNLDNQNTVDTKSPGTIALDVNSCYSPVSLPAESGWFDWPIAGPYIKGLQQSINEAWIQPSGANSKAIVVAFTLHKDGKLSQITLEHSSGSAKTDRAAVKAVESIARYRPLPTNAPHLSTPDEVKFRYTFK